MLSLLLLLLYLQSSLQVWNSNEDEDLQMLVIISRPPVKVYVISIPIYLADCIFISDKVLFIFALLF